MEKRNDILFEAIRAKCQRERWFGSDLDASRWHIIDPDLDVFGAEEKSLTRVTDHPLCFGFAFPPAHEEQVEATEMRLGFPLPPLLRALYTSLANGGFGPGVGLKGIVGGYGSEESGTHADDRETVMDQYRWRSRTQTIDLAEYRKQEDGTERRISLELPSGVWPAQLLPICHLGCAQEACVDHQEQMFLVAPLERNGVYWLLQLSWTLEEWLWRWVKGEELLDRYPPGPPTSVQI